IALTTLPNAGISFLSLLDSDVLLAYHDFSVGGLSGVRLENLAVPGGIILASFGASLLASGRIRLLCLGDNMALSLGVRVRALRLLCLVLASAAASAVVSFAGLLGFVGLVVPHIARKLAGEDTKYLLLHSALLGAILVLVADLLGRALFAPAEVPVGIIMAGIGAPFFFALLLKKRRSAHAEF
ncbi:MAG: iron chelate uptake ABC transporter family permease subunit, partial [Oscillospiraceae bacterium]|nr:iron chelate uptake ABC transporter family permease subunit [Oscillospiraceae bacterium]